MAYSLPGPLRTFRPAGSVSTMNADAEQDCAGVAPVGVVASGVAFEVAATGVSGVDSAGATAVSAGASGASFEGAEASGDDWQATVNSKQLAAIAP